MACELQWVVIVPEKRWMLLLQANTHCHALCRGRDGMKEGKEGTQGGFNIPAPAFPPRCLL